MGVSTMLDTNGIVGEVIDYHRIIAEVREIECPKF